jgi:hypothetical protein
MPWKIEHHAEDKSRPWWIVKKDTGKKTGSSVSRAMAIKALRALYASESSAK